MFIAIDCFYVEMNLNNSLLIQNILAKGGLRGTPGERMVKEWQLRVNRILLHGSGRDFRRQEVHDRDLRVETVFKKN